MIPIGDRVHAVATRSPSEAEIPRQATAVDVHAGTREGATAQRAGVEAVQSIPDAVSISRQHLDICEGVVADGYRLCPL